jgi:hypothetical protein
MAIYILQFAIGECQLKKERIVGLCICVVLLTGLQSLFFGAAVIRQLRVPTCAREGISMRSDILPALVCAGWPPLGFLYGEFQLLHKHIDGFGAQAPTLRAGKSQVRKKAPEPVAGRSNPHRDGADAPQLRTR